MTVLERTDHDFVRRFGADEQLPTPWDAPCEARASDIVIVGDTVRLHPEEGPRNEKTIEGLGWVMLSKVELEQAA